MWSKQWLSSRCNHSSKELCNSWLCGRNNLGCICPCNNWWYGCDYNTQRPWCSSTCPGLPPIKVNWNILVIFHSSILWCILQGIYWHLLPEGGFERRAVYKKKLTSTRRCTKDNVTTRKFIDHECAKMPLFCGVLYDNFVAPEGGLWK